MFALEIEAINTYIEEDIKNFNLIHSEASEIDAKIEENPFYELEVKQVVKEDDSTQLKQFE